MAECSLKDLLVGGIASAFFTYLGATQNGFRIYYHTMWWGHQPRWVRHNLFSKKMVRS